MLIGYDDLSKEELLKKLDEYMDKAEKLRIENEGLERKARTIYFAGYWDGVYLGASIQGDCDYRPDWVEEMEINKCMYRDYEEWHERSVGNGD